MSVTVKCSACGHKAELDEKADVWKCNCAAGVGPDDCNCDHVNQPK